MLISEHTARLKRIPRYSIPSICWCDYWYRDFWGSFTCNWLPLWFAFSSKVTMRAGAGPGNFLKDIVTPGGGGV